MNLSNYERKNMVALLEDVITHITRLNHEYPNKHNQHLVHVLGKLQDRLQMDGFNKDKNLQFVIKGPEKRATDFEVAEILRDAASRANSELGSRLAIILSLGAFAAEMGALDVYSMGMHTILSTIDVTVNPKSFNDN